MTEQTTPKEMTEEEIQQWSRTHYQKAVSFMAEKGVLTETVAVEECRYLAPLMAVWKLKSKDNKWFWVISGDLPTDFITIEGAENARDSLRAFSFRWQMKAEDLRNNPSSDKTQLDFANLLQVRAEGIYQLFEQDDLWK